MQVNGLVEGRTAIVTGAARGIGFAIARRLVQHGARVTIADLAVDHVEEAVAALGGADAGVRGQRCDVTEEADVAALIADTVEAADGALDILVNNAGITRDRAMHKMSLEDFEQVVDVSLKGAWLCTREALKVMRAGDRGGAIVNLSSISGHVGNFGQTNYSAAKAGLVGLTKASAKEGARFGIRVNAIQPGLIRTDMVDAMPADIVEQRIADIPLGRIGEVDDVADGVVFLCSDLSSYVTGAVLPITGGRHM